MSKRIRRPRRAVEIQRAYLDAVVADGDLNNSELQDVPTAYDDQDNDVSTSLNNQDSPPQTFTSTLKQNIPIRGVFNPHFEPGTSSHQISVPVFLADRANVHSLLAIHAQTNHSGLNPLITGQANYQKKRKRIDPEYVDFGLRNCQCQYCGALFWSAEQSAKNASSSTLQFTTSYNSMMALTSMGAKVDASINKGRGPYVFKINGQVGSEMVEKLDHHVVDGLIKMLDECNEVIKLFRLARDMIDEGSTIGDIGEFHTERDIIVENRTHGLQRITKLHPKYMALQYPLLFPYGEDGYKKGLPWNPDYKGKKPKTGGVSLRAFLGYQIQDRPGQNDTLLKGGRLFQQYLVDAYATLEEDRLDFIRANQDSFRTENLKAIHEALKAGNTSSSGVGKRVILPTSFTGSVRYMINNYQDAMAICRHFGNPDLFITFTCNAKWPEIIEDLRDKPGCRPEDRPDIVSRIFKAKLNHMIKFIKSGKPFGDVESVIYTVEFQKRGLPHCHILVWVNKHYKCHSPYDVDSIISAEIPDADVDKVGYDAVSQYMIHGPCGLANRFSPCMKENKCSKKFPKPFTSETTFSDDGFVAYKRRDKENLFVLKNGIKLDNAFVVPYNRELLLNYQAHINVESCCQSTLIKYLFKYITKGVDRARAVFEDEKFDEVVAYLNCRYLCPYEAVWRLLQFHIHFRQPSVERLSVHLPSDQNVVFRETDDLNYVINHPNLERTMLTQWFETNVQDPDARKLSYVEFPTKYVWKNDEKQWSRRKQGRSLGRVAYVHPAAGELYYLRLLLNYQKGIFSFDHLKTVKEVLEPTFQAACMSLGLLGDDREWNSAMLEAVITASSFQLRQLFVTLVLFCDVTDPSALFEAHWKTMCDDISKNMHNAFGLQDLSKYQDELRNSLLYELEKLFTASNSSLSKHHLPQPNNLMMDRLKARSLREELNYDANSLKQEHSLLIGQLNKEQKLVYDSVMETIDNNRSGLFFVHGHGGTGKTFLWTTIITRIRSQNQIVLAVASSGIASLLLPGGRTAHSRFKIPINITDCSVCEIKKGTHLAKLITDATLIVWDEAPMNHKRCFETLDRSLRDVLKGSKPGFDHLPFGGKPILFGGDFRQILPVVPSGSVADIVQASFTSSYLWSYLTIFFLKQNMRLSKTGLNEVEKKELADFAKWILDIGNGTVARSISSTDEESSWVEFPNQFLIHFDEDPIKAMVSAVYTNFKTNFRDVSYLKERAIVTPRNDTATEINDFVLGIVPGESRTYLSFDSVSSATENSENLDMLYPIEFLNQLDLPGLPHHKLSLKVGAPVMLIRNLNQSQGLCNGTRLIVTQLNDRVVQAKIMTGSNIGERVYIPRIITESSQHKYPFTLRRRQFPLKICYAMTINKSQGQSLKIVGLFLSQTVFSHGQLYVALSRVTSKKGLKIVIAHNSDMPYGYTKNIVYKDVLKHLHTDSMLGLDIHLEAAFNQFMQGDAVHATINSRDMHYFFNHLRVGEAYEINKFRVVHNRTSSKVVPHAAIIELNSKTTIVPIDKTSQEIPMHWFNLIELEQLYERIDRDVELTDIFGCLTAVQPIEEITIQRTRIAKKRNLNLQNIRGEIVRITLWGETATNFEDSGIQSLLPPVFVALTGLKVKQYQGKPVLGSTGSTVYFFNPDIPQLSEYKRRFEHLKSPLRILPSSTDMYTGHAIGADSEPKTIDELLLLDPTLHKNASFTCKATVVDFDLARGWWYNSCPSCHKVVKKMAGSFQCNEHGLINKLPEPWFKINLIVEDNTNQHNFLMIGRQAERMLGISCYTLVIENGHEDPFVVPPILNNLVGKSKTFQLSFGKQNSDFAKTDFIVNGLVEDQPLSNPTIASDIPQTPATSVGKQITNQATPAPLTPSQEPDQQPKSVAPSITSKRVLFPDQTDKPDSKKTRPQQTDTTNSARIAREFHNLVVPKIEPADKVPIAALKTKTQAKKTKDSVEDVRSQKK
ncbi:unnamed protein product [Malus baccata var. baccata]